MKHPHDETASAGMRKATGGGVLPALLAVFLSLSAPPAGAVDLGSVSNAVVKLYVTRQGWDVRQPWAREQANVSASCPSRATRW